VTVIQASDLIPAENSTGCDPYVKLYLENLPPKIGENEVPSEQGEVKKLSKVFRTTHKLDTHNPTWSESFNIHLDIADLEKAVLLFEVYDYDKMGHDTKIGKTKAVLKELEVVNFLNKRMENSAVLEKSDGEYLGLGDLCVILRQSPSDNQLHVTILEAKKLSFDPTKYHSAPDVQVSVTLAINNKKLANKKTSWRASTKNPYFSETMIFSIKVSNLSVASIICSLKYKNALGIKKCLGRVTLSPNAESLSGKKHWQEMMDQPRRAIAMWHGLINPKYQDKDDE
ncbi:Arf guanine nucleotide exchange factor syt1, partial [Cichlidogyrus casuarinus]